MKAVILAGGLGTRIAEETSSRPKPMVEIGGKPILWHIMKLYSAHGIKEFVICCGYKGGMIRKYFDDYVLHRADVTYDLGGMTRVISPKSAAAGVAAGASVVKETAPKSKPLLADVSA